MGNSYKSFEDTYVICPFYRGTEQDGRSLHCEGAIHGSLLCHTFISPNARLKYMDGHCKSFAYRSCPISRALEQKYAPD